MKTGRRVYKATHQESYKLDGWSYTLRLRSFKEDGKDKGNRKSLGRYTFSEVGNKKVPYNGTGAEIQFNRLSSCGEMMEL